MNNNQRYKLHHNDCLDVLCEMAENSIDAIVTDPPAGIGFMGLEWDKNKGGRDKWIDWMAEVAAECLRVIKPGGHALVWALPRTSHWTATAWENAGWEPRDRICHIFGSGFPKSANISKMIDKAAGAEQEVIGIDPVRFARLKNQIDGSVSTGEQWKHGGRNVIITAPATDAAKQWDGWGTALKPAVEDYWLFRKPLSKRTVAANVLEWGTGGLNIDKCRVGVNGGTAKGSKPQGKGNGIYGAGLHGACEITRLSAGRFPANLIHDGSDEVVGLFPQSTSGANPTRRGGMGYHGAEGQESCDAPRGAESGSAARFFYAAKASRSEREAGLEVTEEWLDALKLVWHNDTVSNLSEVLLWEEADQNQNTDWSGAVSRAKGIFEATTAQQAGSDSHMLLNGNCATGLFLKAIRCITSTKTRLTIESKTLNSLAHLSINGNTEAVIKTAMEIGLSPAESAALKSLLKAIITSGLAVFPHGVNPAAKKTPQSINAKDALTQRLTANIHSTVKPIALMRYLCRLVTPPGGIVLDPFTGSGTTGCAAMLEGFRFIGIERETEYIEIARRRIEYAISHNQVQHPTLFDERER